MWVLIKGVLLKVAAIKAILQLLKGLGSLGIFIPIALVLSTIGWPALMIIAVLALPVLLLLFVLGLPILLVVGGGAVILSVIGFVLAAAMPLIKVFLFVILPVMIAFWVARGLWKLLFGKDEKPTAPPPASPPPTPATGEI